MTENYKHLVERLNRFKFKFLLFKFIRGIFLLLTVLLVYFLLIVLSENYFFFKPGIKVIIFYFTFLFLAVIFIWLVVIPVIKLFGIVRTMDHKKVASVIRLYLPEINDSLINSIELAEEEIGEYSNELVLAGIDQKIKKLKVFDFNASLKLNYLKSFFYRFLIVTIFSGFIFILFTRDITDSINRLVYYQTEFIKPAPFRFILKNEKLEVKKGSGLKIEMRMEGKDFPEVVFISFGGNNFLMKKEGTDFSYEIENINNSFSFYFVGDNFYSKQFIINVLPVPLLGNFTIKVIPPSYTNLDKETFTNIGNLKVPHGALVKWNFNTFEAYDLIITFNDTVQFFTDRNSANFQFKKQLFNSCNYSVSLKNDYFSEENILNYHIEVVPDLYPQIEVVQIKDSLNYFRYYFKGRISDDYGFSNLFFRLFNGNTDSTISIPFIKSLDQQDFYLTFDFNDLKDNNKFLNYYFSVFDNDKINGYKETSSESFILKFPDETDRRDFENSSFNDIEELMDESFKLNQEIKEDLNNLKMDQINSNLTDWEKQQKVNEIVEKRKDLEEILQKINNKNEELNNYKNSFTKGKGEIIEKQRQIEELLKEVMSDELKKLFDEFNELAKQFNAKKFEELSDQMNIQLDDLSKQLERNLEILKRMKVFQKVQKIVDELYKISKEQKSILVELVEKKNFDKVNTFLKKQKKNFDFQKEEYFSIIDFNKQLRKPLSMADFNVEFSEIGEGFDKLFQLLEKERKKASVDGIKNVSEKTENLAYSIQQMLASNKKKQASEDIENIRQILDNLVYLSVFQENLLSQIKVLQNSDPLINSIKTNQLKVSEQTIIVRDSLYALARRNPQISGIVNNDILNIQYNSDQALKMLEEGKNYNVRIFQQKTMTAFNNLALFISEILKNIEEQMANNMPGDQECDRPGKGKNSNFNMLKEYQESIKDQLQKMIEQMKAGNIEDMSKQLGKTLAQQEIMQKIIREMINDSQIGSSAKEQLKMVDQLMEKSKLDIINKNISVQTINRQNLILNKLLKAEVSEIERDVDNERESKTASDKFYSNPDLFFQYKKVIQKGDEQIQRSNYRLEQYYKKKYEKYLNNIDK